MYRIDIYKRKKDGNRGDKITSSYYKTEREAKQAKFMLKQLTRWTGLLPHDVEAAKLHTPSHKLWHLGNIIISDPEKE